MIDWKQLITFYATLGKRQTVYLIKKNSILWSQNEKKGIEQHCDEWKDHW